MQNVVSDMSKDSPVVSASPAPAETEVGTSALLRTLLLCDLVGSTALVEKLGDRAAAELIRKHDRMARTVADRHGGREIDKTDGFLMMFDRPIQAVAFALDYQRGLRQLNAAEQSSLAARVGIHVGDVVVWDNTPEDIAKGAKPIEVEGLVKPIASRLMNLALPGQVLLSNIAYALAHRAQGELGVQLERVRWRTYGRYRFKGIPDPIPVFEVGEEGTAPLKAPPWSGKAHREIPFWRRPATVVIEALVLALLVAIPLYTFLKPAPAIAFANRDWVVVGNLNNLTGETVFDEALESALRIALEQSRYVNVLPDLKVRDTVKRMERDPDKTRIDRAIGSEIAIRDGVKALILPTVAEVGGRVRITAEVIDPHTQTTVYSESADGVGAESVLTSLDLVNQRLRVRLGEALATVSQDSQPLQQVTTSNLDALRAYSLGMRSYVKGEFDNSLEFHQQALKIDPQFLSAWIRIGAVYISAGRARDALQAFEAAIADRSRLSIRDAMYADVMILTLQSPDAALPKWAVLAESYPDYFAGSGGYAYVSWKDANRFDDKTLGIAEIGASNRNPNPTPSLHLVGILHTGRGEYDKARQSFTTGESMGFVRTEYHSASYAAERKLELARTTLARSPLDAATANPVANLTRNLFEAAFRVDAERRGDARKVIADARAALPHGHGLSLFYEVVGLSLDGDDATAHREALAAAVKEGIRLRSTANDVDKASIEMNLAILAYLASRDGAPAAAADALAALPSDDAEGAILPRKMRAVARARATLAAGHAPDAVLALERLLDASELYVTHIALADAYAAAGRPNEALKEVQWLATHRGRAYAEPPSALTVSNVEQSTLAYLREAELSREAGDAARMKTALEAFRAAWPKYADDLEVRRRVETLQSADPPPVP